MRHDAHPLLALEAFLKEAQAAQRPAGMSDMRSKGQKSLGKGIQSYAQPNPPAAMTRPELAQPQKDLPPPPVM